MPCLVGSIRHDCIRVGCYRIVYEDGDMEDLDLPSLKAILVAKVNDCCDAQLLSEC